MVSATCNGLEIKHSIKGTYKMKIEEEKSLTKNV